MPFVKIWIHAVWAVKNREPILNQGIRRIVFGHIHENASRKEIFMDSVGGYNNHVHCLFRLRNSQSIDQVMQLIKGESSFWFNKNNLSAQKLTWQKEYYAVSVSESGVENVRRYIRNQEEHHRKKTWDDEYNEYMTKYRFEILKSPR